MNVRNWKNIAFSISNIVSVFVIVCLSGAHHPVAASEPLIQDISDRKYFDAVDRLIHDAQDSIYVAVYLCKVDFSKPRHRAPAALLDALILAAQRGVRVSVLFDQSKDDMGHSRDRNTPAYTYLSDHGVEVRWDSLNQTLHSKVMIVDQRYVVVGSTNWTYSAFWYNQETSLLIDSSKLARQLLTSFETGGRDS